MQKYLPTATELMVVKNKNPIRVFRINYEIISSKRQYSHWLIHNKTLSLYHI